MAKKLKPKNEDLFKVEIPEMKSELNTYQKNDTKTKPKSKNEAASLGTNCKECIFHEVDGKNCLLGKINKYIERGAKIEERDDKFLIDRVCSFRRTQKWKKQHRRRRNIDQCTQDVKGEVHVSGTIFVYADDLEDLDKCFSQLSQTSYVEHFKVVVAHFDDLKIKDVYDYFHEQTYINSPIAVGIKDSEDTNFLDEAFKRADNGLMISLDSKMDVDKDMLNKLQKYIYNEMHRIIYVKPTKGVHGLVSLALLYKYLKGNKLETFEEKLKLIAKEQGIESQLTTWEVINESIS